MKINCFFRIYTDLLSISIMICPVHSCLIFFDMWSPNSNFGLCYHYHYYYSYQISVMFSEQYDTHRKFMLLEVENPSLLYCHFLIVMTGGVKQEFFLQGLVVCVCCCLTRVERWASIERKMCHQYAGWSVTCTALKHGTKCEAEVVYLGSL